MLTPLFCHWHNESSEIRKNRHQKAIARLGLHENKVIPVFDEATQISAHILQSPICILGILDGENYYFKSGFGFANFGLNSDLIRDRKISRDDSFATHIIDSKKPLQIENTTQDSFFFDNVLVQHHQVKSYLGVPLITADGECVGCLEVFDLQSRQFSDYQLEFLILTARWCMAEYERDFLANQVKQKQESTEYNFSSTISDVEILATDVGKKNINYSKNLSIKLINKLIEKISVPLTSVIGMSSVLKQGIYGKVNAKQLEYLNIVYDSGQEITTLLDEIVSLGAIEDKKTLDLTIVDIEILGEQIINSLQMSAQNKECSLRLSVEPGEKVWYLDREKIKQTIYYLLTTIIETARPGGNIQVHISQKQAHIKITMLVKHPWLGDGIPYEKTESYIQAIQQYYDMDINQVSEEEIKSYLSDISKYSYDLTTLLFSCYLTDLQQGDIKLQGTSELGYRFQVSIPAQPHHS
ncbi:GAF domain protein [Cyanobacterium stanieri PCC 7202]|uniref:histidine kinase n=1 Tax=Cyanobacterium stanieri (strain ATCC 29140 / PCC 7202) TaxID=292563 RepID=K9YIU3_CYASC|nr:GAF domain protein [Cyanobacterium stanieri PCC 7202]